MPKKIKRVTLGLCALLTLAIAGDVGAKVKKESTPSICCVIPCTPPLVCKVR